MPATMAANTPTSPDLLDWMHRWERVLIDLGSGDAAYARHRARQDPALGVIALDLRLDRLPKHARRQPTLANLCHLEADAVAWCAEIACDHPRVRFDEITINFPYGALLRACIAADGHFAASLTRLLRPAGSLTVRLNARALLDSAPGVTWTGALDAVGIALRANGLRDIATTSLPMSGVRAFPSSWAKRIGWGRPTEVACLTARGTAAQVTRQEISRIDIPCYDRGD